MKIIIATTNEGKMKEFKRLLENDKIEVVSMKEAGIDVDIEENGKTFAENAAIKAKAVCAVTNTICLADDSGLEVDFLNKEPGIHSARWMGHDTPYELKNQTIIDKLEGIEDEKRTARFVCAVAAAFPNGTVMTVTDTFEGIIAHEAAGCGGFGYDPIFFYPPAGKTSAEMTSDEKNAVSHRGKALRRMVAFLKMELMI